MALKAIAPFFLSLAVCACSADAQSVQAVLNSASFTTTVAPGTWVTIFGTQLAPGPMTATAVPFPTILNGVSVTIAGIAAPLSYVSAGQINALIPFEVPRPASSQQTTVAMIVTTPSGPLPTFSLSLHRDAPAIYTKNQMGTGDALAFDAAFNAVTTVDTKPILLYATGLGPTDPPAVTGSLGSNSEPLNRAQDVGGVVIGGRTAQVLYAGLAPGLQGIYQLNVVPDPFVGNSVVVTAGIETSKPVTLPIVSGTHVTNSIGTITALYPAADASTVLTFSPLLIAAAFTLGFDVNPGSQPFRVIALAGNSCFAEINIDPVKNTWTANRPAPPPAARSGDFSGASFLVRDFLSGTIFPGNQIPTARMDPKALQIESMLPLPNTGPLSGENGTNIASGTLPVGGHFAIDSTTLPSLMNFGCFTNVQQTSGTNNISYRLYIDNALVASQSVTFTIP